MPTTIAKPTAKEVARNHFVYSEAMYHRDLQLRRADIAEGIKAFRELTGQDANLITLHPGNKPLADAVPEGVTVSYCGGCLKWQVWLAVGTIKPDKEGNNSLSQNTAILPIIPNDAPRTLVQALPVEGMPQTAIKPTHRGRRPKIFPEDTIRQLKGQGMTLRAIRQELKNRGTTMSLMSIHRIITGQRTLPLPG